MKRYGAVLGFAAALGATTFSSFARADNPLLGNNDGLDTHLFRPALDSKGFFATNGSDILGHLDFSVGLIVDYGRSILRTDGALTQGRTNALISNSFQGTFGFNLGLFNHVEVGLDVPIILMDGAPQYYNQGCPGGGIVGTTKNCNDGPYIPGVQNWGSAPTTTAPAKSLDSQNVEFLAIHAKWRITRVEKGFGLALGLQAGVAVSDAYRQGGGDRGWLLWPQLIGEKRFGATGKFKVGLNAGFRAHDTSATSLTPIDARMFDTGPGTAGTLQDGNRITYSLATSYRATDVLDLVLDTYGTYLVGGQTTDALRASNEVTAGIKLFVERNSYFMLGAGPRYTPGFEAADFAGSSASSSSLRSATATATATRTTSTSAPTSPKTSTASRTKTAAPIRTTTTTASSTSTIAAPTSPKIATAIRTKTAAPKATTATATATASSTRTTSAPTNRKTATASRTQTAAPIRTTTRTASPTSRTLARTIRKTKTASRTRTAAPIRTTTTTASRT